MLARESTAVIIPPWNVNERVVVPCENSRGGVPHPLEPVCATTPTSDAASNASMTMHGKDDEAQVMAMAMARRSQYRIKVDTIPHCFYVGIYTTSVHVS